MSNYIGVRCPVCNKKFTQTDDIVVCPICGAPHHRECYAEKGACAFVSDHISGKEWSAPPPEPQTVEGAAGSPFGYANPAAGAEASGAVVTCPVCKATNPCGMIFCQVCGRRISEVSYQNPAQQSHSSWGFPPFMQELDPISLMYGGVLPDEKIDGESARDIAVYIGENSAYYLPRFKNMFERSNIISFNFSALIFSFIYFFYRKMYLIGAALLALSLLSMIPSVYLMREVVPQIINAWINSELPVNHNAIIHYQSIVQTSNSVSFFIGFAVSLLANHLYYMKVMSDVKALREGRAGEHDEIAYNKALSQKGGVSKAAVIAVFTALVILHMAIGFILMYQSMAAGGFMVR